MKSAENTGMTCQFTHVSESADRAQGGGRERKDVHLDRMAAYLVAMNGDLNKPEVSAAQAYFAVKTRQAEKGGSLPFYPVQTAQKVRGLLTMQQTGARIDARSVAPGEGIPRTPPTHTCRHTTADRDTKTHNPCYMHHRIHTALKPLYTSVNTQKSGP